MRSIVFLILTPCVFAQNIHLSAGFKIGAPLNDASGRNTVVSTYLQNRWTGGPSVELHLPKNFAVEFNALHKSYREQRTYLFGSSTGTTHEKTNAWEFPLLLKYRFQMGSIRPFMSAGHFWTHESRQAETISNSSGVLSYYRYSSTGAQRGIVTGGGVEFKASRMKIAPEVRFSRPTYGSPRDNRVGALVGFSF